MTASSAAADGQLSIRAMRWWDIPLVHDIEASSFASDAWSVEQFWSELAAPTRAYLVAEANHEILGYAGLYLLPPDADVQTVAVAARARGRGVGRLLVEALIECATSSGCRSVLLEVRCDNTAAISLYRGLGFAEISRRSRYYADGSDALVMRRVAA